MTSFQHIASTCAMQEIRRAAREVTRLYEEALRPVGLTASQFSILIALAQAETVNLSALADALGMDRTTLTRVLAPMERSGRVLTLTSPKDARARLLALTDSGRATLETAVPLWEAAQSHALHRLGPAWTDIRSGLRNLST